MSSYIQLYEIEGGQELANKVTTIENLLNNGNFTVKQLAEAAQKAIPGTEIFYSNEHTDPRTYRVSFNRILTELKDYYKPEWDLGSGAEELKIFFDKIKFSYQDFIGHKTNRLTSLKKDYLKKFNEKLRKI